MNTDPTPEQLKWWKRFHRIVADMPEGMEVIVGGYGSLTAAPDGAVKAAMDAGGDAGGAEVFCLNSLSGYRFRDGGSGV